jgi:thioredoxin 1
VSLPHNSIAQPQKLTRIDRFAVTYDKAKFYKVDVDAAPDVAQELGIRAMPTFKIFKNGAVVATVVGANPKALEVAIQEALAG